MRTRHQLRRLHRALVPLAALPIILTALSGSLYGLLSAREIEAFWLMKLHTGNFGLINLQPWYSAILGLLTLVVAGSGLGLLIGARRGQSPQN
ncbi:hypothetical protein VB734_01530 [Synechococcus sp. BA-124 BA4]|jgi:hypothetical protein|uniref:hypothetical protein n=1 Tax=unclassified Synechococcus TaxID=2626047 RepID=UPI0018CF2996|nr:MULTISPECIES: hypothetical protein [unclassified Synechococcus]MEA5398722.1 hypothetical protein [Synechococcus sp. BA-124 BA4]QPN56744.1 hypothetical protein I1E95_00565 [Synechococcus sp. CBW1107]CAK6696174.1 hypothetical protein BBFGKLBO_01997 [Synechococcus sp. CBW1107]